MWLHAYQHTLCIVAIVHVALYTMLSKISKHTISCRYCGLLPYRVGTIAQQNTAADILVEDQPRLPLDVITVDQEWELHKPNSWIGCQSYVLRIVNRSRVPTVYTLSPFYYSFLFLTRLRNRRDVDVWWNICSLLALKLWWGDLLYSSYDEGAYCTPVMMRGHIVGQLWWENLL